MDTRQDTIHIRTYEPRDATAVVELWNDCGLVVPQNNPHKDIETKVGFQPDLFFICECENRIVGTVMAGYEGHRGWINYLAVFPGYRRLGIGKTLMDHAEEKLRVLGCPKINLQVRESNSEVISFYETIGFRKDHVISLGKRL